MKKVLVLVTYHSQVDAMKETMKNMKVARTLADIIITGIPFNEKTFDATIKEAIDEADYTSIESDYSNKKDSFDSIEFTKAAMKYSHDNNKQYVMISLRNTYDVAYFLETNSVLLVYGPNGYKK
ncbi:hypothetical protein ACIKIA_28805 [Bacillus thuringiensis]